MSGAAANFGSARSNAISVDDLLSIFRNLNCDRVLFKRLAPNDNSKNQPYFGAHLTDLSFIPIGNVEASETKSQKKASEKRRAKFTAVFPFSWVDVDGCEYPAPNTKLIYYPQYPEVRLSGFLQRSGVDSDGWMDPYKRGREEGRVLVLGISQDKQRTYGFFAAPNSRVAGEIAKLPSTKVSNIFQVIWDGRKFDEDKTSREILLEALARIHRMGWISSRRLKSNGTIIPYTAPNGGGYTLEAELGVIPNGDGQPDYLGWEVKQFQVSNFLKAFQGKPLTLLTPEPNGGYYVEKGVIDFLITYGSLSQKITDRYDFTGHHRANSVCSKTGLKLTLIGFDNVSGKISDSSGAIALIDAEGNCAASWGFNKIIEHWNKKHANAVYVPAKKDKDACPPEYYYSNLIRLYTSTNINLFMRSISSGFSYYDPGIKLLNASSCPRTKRRNQFRVKARDLDALYLNREDVDLTTIGTS